MFNQEEPSAEDVIVEDLETPTNRPRFSKQRPRQSLPPKAAVQIQQRQKKLLWQKGKLIGTGGFGKVYLGIDGNSGSLIAGKEFNFSQTENQRAVQLQALQGEIRVMKALHHPNIVQYLGADYRGSLFYIFMDYIPGGSLRSILQQFGPLGVNVASHFSKQILKGLRYLHRQNVIHRDIKCANVLVTVDGIVKLADFGSAQYFAEARGTEGTPFWMAPEVIRGGKVTWQADIWSLGCTVMEMFTARAPFEQQGVSNLKIMYHIASGDPITIPDAVEHQAAREFVELCLQKDATRRPTVESLLDHDFINISRRTSSGGTIASTMSFASTYDRDVPRVQASRASSWNDGSNPLAIGNTSTTSNGSGSGISKATLAIHDAAFEDSTDDDLVVPLEKDVKDALVKNALQSALASHHNVQWEDPMEKTEENLHRYISKSIEVERTGLELDVDCPGMGSRQISMMESEVEEEEAKCISTIQKVQAVVLVLLVLLIGGLVYLVIRKSD